MSKGSGTGGAVLTGLVVAAGAWFLWSRYLKTGSVINFGNEVENALADLPVASAKARQTLTELWKGADKSRDSYTSQPNFKPLPLRETLGDL